MNPVDEQSEQGASPADPNKVQPAETPPVGVSLVEEDPAARLAEQLKETEGRLRAVSAAYKNLQSDMHAFQKRLERQQELKLEVSRGETVSSLFEPLEDLRRSINVIEKAVPDRTLIEGLEMVHREFMEGFRKLGLAELAEKGDPFNPDYHEVLTVIPVADPTLDGRIMEVFAQGYKVGTRLIRPAKVVVGQALPQAPAEG